MIDAIVFALSIVVPNLALMGLGFFMRRQGQLSKPFIDEASKLVFNYALPSLLFFSILGSDVDLFQQVDLLSAGLVATLALFFGAEIYAKYFIKRPEDKGVFVQGVFRSNMAIIGLSTVANAYGSVGVSIGAVYMGVMTLVFNVLAVITLSRTPADTSNARQNERRENYLFMLSKRMLTNPLILSLIAAFAYKFLDSVLSLPQIPDMITQTGELLATISLPLALICAGATIDMRSMLTFSGLSMQASIGRIVVAPLLAIAIGFAFGLTGVHMGVLFLMVASPTAAASYVMAKAMGGNEVLAANILAFTTVVSLFGMAIGAAALRALGWM